MSLKFTWIVFPELEILPKHTSLNERTRNASEKTCLALLYKAKVEYSTSMLGK